MVGLIYLIIFFFLCLALEVAGQSWLLSRLGIGLG